MDSGYGRWGGFIPYLILVGLEVEVISLARAAVGEGDLVPVGVGSGTKVD